MAGAGHPIAILTGRDSPIAAVESDAPGDRFDGLVGGGRALVVAAEAEVEDALAVANPDALEAIVGVVGVDPHAAAGALDDDHLGLPSGRPVEDALGEG